MSVDQARIREDKTILRQIFETIGKSGRRDRDEKHLGSGRYFELGAVDKIAIETLRPHAITLHWQCASVEINTACVLVLCTQKRSHTEVHDWNST